VSDERSGATCRFLLVFRPIASSLLTVAVGLLAGTGCTAPGEPPGPPADAAPSAAAVIEIASPAAPGSAEPRLTRGADGRLYLSWIEPRDDGVHALVYARWEDGAWSEPRTIASGTDWFVNWADFPALAANAAGDLAAHWLVRSGDAAYAYDVVLSTSKDSGATWSPPIVPHRDGTPTEHGFVSIVPAMDGSFDVVWLDGRRAAAAPPGPMTLRHARLSVEGEVSDAVVIDSSVCDCCPTDARRTADGRLLVVYRGRTEDEIRDIRLAAYDGATWSEPVSVHADGWKIAGCPVNGPAIAIAERRVAVAWYTEADAERGAVRVAYSDNGGDSFGPPSTVDDDEPLGRVDLAMDDGGTVWISWLGRRNDEAVLLVRRLVGAAPEAPPLVATRTSVSRSSGFPQLVCFGGETLLAWTETGERSRVRTGRLPLAAPLR
jgi:hypothetical protein